MKRLIVSVLLLLIATFVFSQAETYSQDKSATNEAVNEQPVQKEQAIAEVVYK
ncbi:hypothetical protein [Formosa haliotis]|uniref:hypothetical protein n=1 Tax=Formosa haliotis TaxID=1555194 RepID=UPI0013566941|nr:hypothetical protein [Formosa haliotis]